MIAVERCAACRFWLEAVDEKGKTEDGFCRRFPPMVVGPKMLTMFPRMRPIGWCGEFQVRES